MYSLNINRLFVVNRHQCPTNSCIEIVPWLNNTPEQSQSAVPPGIAITYVCVLHGRMQTHAHTQTHTHTQTRVSRSSIIYIILAYRIANAIRCTSSAYPENQIKREHQIFDAHLSSRQRSHTDTSQIDPEWAWKLFGKGGQETFSYKNVKRLFPSAPHATLPTAAERLLLCNEGARVAVHTTSEKIMGCIAIVFCLYLCDLVCLSIWYTALYFIFISFSPLFLSFLFYLFLILPF